HASQGSMSPDILSDVRRHAQPLYALRRRRFIACQMPPARYLSSTITAVGNDYELRARGRIMKFDGWTRILPPMGRKGQVDMVLPDLQKATSSTLRSLIAHSTLTSRPHGTLKQALWKSQRKRVSAAPQPMRRLFPPFKTEVMCA